MKIDDNGTVREMTAAEAEEFEQSTAFNAEMKIQQLKQNLIDTDYKAIKYAEGFLTAEEYLETKSLRQSWRNEINILENEENNE